MSIFREFDARTNESQDFWCGLGPTHSQDIVENLIAAEEVIIRSKSLQSKDRWILLTKTTIYSCYQGTRNPKKQSIISWKQVNPFVENSGDVKTYGFTLGEGTCSQDFFLKSKLLLDNFLFYLNKVAIQCDFDFDYIIIKPIDSGSYATVYLAQDSATHEEFAVKSVSKGTILSSSRGVSSITNEISIMKAIDSPYFVKLFKVYEDSTHVHLVMDYIEGGTLFNRIKKIGKFPEKTAITLFKNLLMGVQYLQSLNMIHRDLKPTNVLMCSKTNDEECKIMDFGLSCYVSSGSLLCCGSPGFIAPEVLKKMPYDFTSDNFSLGVILFNMLAARSPFNARSVNELVASNREGTAIFDTRDWNGVSREAIDLVMSLMNPNPESRATVAQALNHRWLNSHNKLHSCALQIPTLGNMITLRPTTGISINLMDRIIHKPKEEEIKITPPPVTLQPPNLRQINAVAKSRNMLMNLRE